MTDTIPIHVVATLVAKPGLRDDALGGLRELAAASQRDAGCRSYVLTESKATPGDFCTIEEWDGEDALHAHLAKHAEALERLAPMLDHKPEITVLLAR